ncbi:hypothetical protein KAR91_59325 [Candidatus Pacearchaeota archaeon]|nr:hypothetical protein [Candidatus Pacearchaeota archaeon]
MRNTPPGRTKWSRKQLKKKLGFNQRKLEALTVLANWTKAGYDFNSEDLAEELNITRKYASILLLRYKKRGLIVQDHTEVSNEKWGCCGQPSKVYRGTPALLEKAEIIRQRTIPPVDWQPGKKPVRRIEL